MHISRFKLTIIFSLVALALFGLMYMQIGLLTKNIEENEEQVELAIPAILLEVNDRLNWNRPFKRLLHDFEGTEEFQIQKGVEAGNELTNHIKVELEKTLALNYSGIDYQLNAFVSNEYSCLFHSHHHHQLPKADRVMSDENHLCLCGLGPTTFDISMSSPNKRNIALGKSWPSVVASLLLTAFILVAFIFAITIINRQKKLSEMKQDFVNNLTHEFKTPIFSISLAAKALKQSGTMDKRPDLQRYVGVIENEGIRLKNQVDKILQMALIDSGNLTLERKQVDLHAIIEKVSESFKVIIKERQGGLSMDLKSTNRIVLADETHLKNIIYNLLDNAQKYSEGPPEIHIKTEDHQNGIIFSVSDQGIGMDAHAQKFIFDQFYRAGDKKAPETKGFGLGLSYVKSIVEAHRGWINLESQLDKGSQFTIYLPWS